MFHWIGCRGKQGADPLFPNWSKDRARDLIKEAAIAFGWDPTVHRDGMHCMRHGAAQEHRACSKDRGRSVMKRAVWASVSSGGEILKTKGASACLRLRQSRGRFLVPLSLKINQGGGV